MEKGNKENEIDFNDPNAFKKEFKKEAKKSGVNLSDAPKGVLNAVMNHKGKIAIIAIYLILSGVVANIILIVSFVKFLIH